MARTKRTICFLWWSQSEAPDLLDQQNYCVHGELCELYGRQEIAGFRGRWIVTEILESVQDRCKVHTV